MAMPPDEMLSPNYGENLALAHNLVLLVVKLDLCAPVFRHEHFVAFLDVERNVLAAVVKLAGADGNHLAFDRIDEQTLELKKGDACLVPHGVAYTMRADQPATFYRATVPTPSMVYRNT